MNHAESRWNTSGVWLRTLIVICAWSAALAFVGLGVFLIGFEVETARSMVAALSSLAALAMVALLFKWWPATRGERTFWLVCFGLAAIVTPWNAAGIAFYAPLLATRFWEFRVAVTPGWSPLDLLRDGNSPA